MISYIINAGGREILYLRIEEEEKRTVIGLIRLYTQDYTDWDDLGRWLKDKGYNKEYDFAIEKPVMVVV